MSCQKVTNLLYVKYILAYCDCARSTSGSQNLAVLPKRHDNSLIFSHPTKIKSTVGKLLCMASTSS